MTKTFLPLANILWWPALYLYRSLGAKGRSAMGGGGQITRTKVHWEKATTSGGPNCEGSPWRLRIRSWAEYSLPQTPPSSLIFPEILNGEREVSPRIETSINQFEECINQPQFGLSYLSSSNVTKRMSYSKAPKKYRASTAVTLALLCVIPCALCGICIWTQFRLLDQSCQQFPLYHWYPTVL